MRETIIPLIDACPLCGKQGAFEKKIESEYKVVFGTKDGTIEYVLKDIESFRCGHCGDGFFDKYQVQLLDWKLRAEKMRQALLKVTQSAVFGTDIFAMPRYMITPELFDTIFSVLDAADQRMISPPPEEDFVKRKKEGA